MVKVYQYPMPFLVNGYFELRMPKMSRVLSVSIQRDRPQLWALVNPDHETEKRLFFAAKEGHSINDPSELNFVGTLPAEDGSSTFHIFEVSH